MHKGRAIFLYDIITVLSMLYVVYGMPNLFAYIQNQYPSNGKDIFYYMYPAFDYAAEWFMDCLLSRC
jgi:hypothetical protein